MPHVDEIHEAAPARPRTAMSLEDFEVAWNDLNWSVQQAIEDGNLIALIAIACEAAEGYHPPDHNDPGRGPHAGVQAAIRAYDSWKHSEGQVMDFPAFFDRPPGPEEAEPEIVPLAYVGKWVAWSSDGMHILAAAETIEEAERLAAEAGESEPIMMIPPAPQRL